MEWRRLLRYVRHQHLSPRNARWGCRVERDLWFKPGPIDQVLRRERPSAAVREGEV